MKKRLIPKAIQCVVFVLAILGVALFCDKQTQGFRYYALLSDLPNDPRWEVPSLSETEQKEINRRLNQPFTFLNRGGWCYAFLGADQRTILKFYKHEHLSPLHLVKHFSLPKLLLKSASLPSGARYFQEFNFTSCALLYSQAKEWTGLFYVHLNKTEGKHGKVTLFDKIGIRHEIDLDQTEFVVQERADLLFERLSALEQQKDLLAAQRALDSLFTCLLSLSERGIRDMDQKLYENFGYVGDQAIALDISSFISDPEIRRPAEWKKEILFKTNRLGRWLKKHYPELLPYFDNKINALLESSTAL